MPFPIVCIVHSRQACQIAGYEQMTQTTFYISRLLLLVNAYHMGIFDILVNIYISV